MNPIINQPTQKKTSNPLGGSILPLEGSPRSLNLGSEFTYAPEGQKQKLRTEEFFRARARETNTVYSLKQKEIEQKIENILEQLKALSKKVKHIKAETEQTLTQSTKNPGSGKYYISFLDMIRNTLEFLLINMETNQAINWRRTASNRGDQIKNYWGGVKKKGASFMLSHERQLATSTG